MSGDHKFKEGDSLLISMEATNHSELLFFTNNMQVYKAKASDFDETKISVLGDYVASSLDMDRKPLFIWL